MQNAAAFLKTQLLTNTCFRQGTDMRGEQMVNLDPGQDSAVRAGFNAEFLSDDRSQRIFAHHLKRLDIIRVLDVGSNSGQFASKLRTYGYHGVIYSVEPSRSAYAQLVGQAKPDMRWIPLARQGVGMEKGFVDLNMSDNSCSSSEVEEHPGDDRAGMRRRTFAAETAYINKSGELLEPQVLSEIEALKIDAQGFEEQVIRGYLTFMSRIRLLLLKLSLVECHRGTPNLFSLDRFLVNDLSFCRISLEPSYYDDFLGVVQQYDGIYYKPDQAPRHTVPLGLGKVRLVTSTSRTIKRKSTSGEEVGSEWLNACLQSWSHISSDVCSVSETPPTDDRINWLRTQRRPSIGEILSAVANESGKHIVLVNADIFLTDAFRQILPTLDPSTVYYGSRVDADASRAPNNRFELSGQTFDRWGFDVFVLPPSFISLVNQEKLVPEEFKIGEPWWDYLLPVLAMAYGFPIKKFRSHNLALHLRHEQGYSRDAWFEYGQRFVASILKMKSDSRCAAPGVLSEMIEVEGSVEEQLYFIFNMICCDLP